MGLHFKDTPNGRRSKACWNACEGVPTVALQPGLMVDAIEVIEALLTDYRTEGCPDPECGVCKRSNAASIRATNFLKIVTGE